MQRHDVNLHWVRLHLANLGVPLQDKECVGVVIVPDHPRVGQLSSRYICEKQIVGEI